MELSDYVIAGIIGEVILDEEDDTPQESGAEEDLFYEPFPGEEL